MVRLGANIAMATLDQHRESLDPTVTVAEALTGGHGDTVTIGGQPRHVVSYMKDFLFTPEQARTPLGVLSGGERGRLMLARALAKPSNVLVLDEPTNDLDLETLDVLQEMLADYAGTILLISHDRDFLDRVVNGVIVPEGGGKWTEYAGGYSDMLAQRGQDLKQIAREPTKPAASRSSKEGNTSREAKPAKRRLSFHEKHALDTLPKTIASLQARIDAAHMRLDDPTLYARDRKAFDAESDTLAAAQSELAVAEEKWLELEILRDEIEGAESTSQ
jgi:ATP-binding cassette subfamily F protein uup